ncbi:uncharacterized protein THITE_2124229 [Thermothielavioides terrestris NRRL 8126]|uniref:Uncharacterized protein n=1 Tax=Thermothielavioides terrestris (strain ATCC 38088 / NRRL 8126) TaxID=578455 RepID=G2RIF3_THETT|nr:uncharacterized protein THITE_2124229 [Thermothielavioides terrestris NRRL 8126]AEO71615.1 hypothetical protein THITE_2124229 [Thermothielavioides terrestris NRRL 8126]
MGAPPPPRAVNEHPEETLLAQGQLQAWGSRPLQRKWKVHRAGMEVANSAYFVALPA